MMDWDEMVDCEGLLCPLPVLRARKRLMAMVAGQVLCLRATDGMARIDLPHFCAQAGHGYLGTEEEGGVTLHFLRAGGGVRGLGAVRLR
jgi:tRNA 2-thiouridine synthesizing protein A